MFSLMNEKFTRKHLFCFMRGELLYMFLERKKECDVLKKVNNVIRCVAGNSGGIITRCEYKKKIR